MIGTVSKKLQKKLDPHAPPRSLVENYLIEIAKEKLHIIYCEYQGSMDQTPISLGGPWISEKIMKLKIELQC